MVWCLPSYLADKFLAMIKDGSISPEKMLDMTSEQRREFFTKEFGGEANGQKINALLESKMILKNQQKGMVTWAKKVSGITPEAQRGLVNRVNKMSEILTPETEDAFLEDLAAHVLGTTVTMEEAGNITTLAQEVALKEEAYDMEKEAKAEDELGKNYKPSEERLKYGRSLIAFDNYVGAVKAEAAKETIPEKAQHYLANPFEFVADVIDGIASSSREMRTTLDNSFVGKQGAKFFFKGLAGDFKSAKIWMDTFKRSFKLIYGTFTGQQVMDELNAEMISDPQYDMMKKARVALFTVEEEMPSDWFNHVPYVGRPFAAAHNAYTGSAHYMRYRAAKYYFKIAEKTKSVDLQDKDELQSIGKLVNSLTGRGAGMTRGEGPTLIDKALFSRRMLKADWDVVTAHRFDKKMTSFAKKQAAINLLQIIVGQAMTLGIASLLLPGSVEKDPHSADNGRIVVGNTRYDISGGTGALIRLAVRLLPLILNKDTYIKSTTSGKKKKLNTGRFGSTTGLDVLEDFVENKSSPIASIILAHLAGEYPYTDIKPTLGGDIKRLFTPLSIENIGEVLEKGDENAANTLVAIIADMLGVFTNTYGAPKPKITLQPLEY